MASLRADLTAHLVDELFFGDPGAALAPGDDLFELGLDSLGIQRLLVWLERRAKVRIPDSEVVADHFRTVGDIAVLVERLSGR